MNFFKNIFNFNKREIDTLRVVVEKINAIEDVVRDLKDSDFPKETNKLKTQIQSGEKKLDEVLPYAYALTREAARRVLNERHFDEQLMAGIALHQGKVVEQKTGEGKTLSASCPLYLNALTGRGVHLVTVNDYLARRDSGWIGQVFDFLGLKTAAIISDKSFIFDKEYFDTTATDWRLIHLREIDRKEAYDADITYGINSEFGFDYLRDNMVFDKNQMVQRGFNFAIIDEVDSVLIDEARTPHIISAPNDEDTSRYYSFAQLVNKLDESDYVIDEKTRTVHLNEKGIDKIEQLLNKKNIYESDYDSLFHIEAALKAKALFKNDKDYIVKDNEVVIVDEFTGRLLQGRRFSEGLHQAIEAKENVSIKQESKTLATVSLQNYFRMYDKLSGMTGTAVTEAEEFHKIYKLDVLVLPTHRNIQRVDHPDKIYKTEKGKFDAVIEDVIENYKKGRPVLIGTTSIEKNEILSSLLKKKGIPHELLNAKNHEREAQIISSAGKKGAITVATNMAGRGVDIILGGAPPNKYEMEEGKAKMSEKEYEKQRQLWQKSHDEVLNIGGLYVIGTERHESRRIDNQLRGRSGRQGDPGETRFFVSLEDDMMRIFGGEQVSKLMTFFNLPEDQPLEHKMVNKVLEQAQIKVEGFNFDIRKHLVDFDDVINKQREIIYKLRREFLYSATTEVYKEFKEKVLNIVYDEIKDLINSAVVFDGKPNYEFLVEQFGMIVPINSVEFKNKIEKINSANLEDFLQKEAELFFVKKEKEFTEEIWLQILKSIIISTIDKYWTENLTAIDDLREGINLRGYAQIDPLVAYKNEAFVMFEKLYRNINYEISRRIFRVELANNNTEQLEKKPEQKKINYRSASSVNPFSSSDKQDIKKQETNNSGFKITEPGAVNDHKKLGRNDLCWCGSGKKYKKCHYPN